MNVSMSIFTISDNSLHQTYLMMIDRNQPLTFTFPVHLIHMQSPNAEKRKHLASKPDLGHGLPLPIPFPKSASTPKRGV